MAKIRQGFVSNSSSSSFIVRLDDITAKQLQQICQHQDVGSEMGLDCAATDPWEIELKEDTVEGSTYMDNFDMAEFLLKIGVPENVVRWGD